MSTRKDAAAFLKGITAQDNVVIVFNNDGDGTCSCAIVCALLAKRGCAPPLLIAQPMPPEEALLRKIQTTVPSKLIFLDMAMDHEPDHVKRLARLCDTLIIDHHIVRTDVSRRGLVHYNPRMQKPKVYQSTSYLAYKTCAEVEPMENRLWIAGVGMVADYNLDDSGDIAELIRKQYGIAEKTALYETQLGRIADMISAAKATKKLPVEKIVAVLLATDDMARIHETHDGALLLASLETVNDEMERIRIDASEHAERNGNVVLYELSSPYNLRSPVSTMLSERDRDKLVLIYSHSKNQVDVSARNQSKRFNVGKMFEQAVNGLKASGGGHEAAAGAKVAAKDWDAFRERVLDMANRQ